MPVSVLVIDDDPAVVTVLVSLIEFDERLTVHATATDGLQALAAVEQGCPDGIICDVRMPRLGGLEALPRLRKCCPAAAIVMYTSDPDIAGMAKERGADDVVGKSAGSESVLDVVVRVRRDRDRAAGAASPSGER